MGRKIQWFSQTFEQGRPCSKYTPNRTQHFLNLTQLRFRCQDTPSDLHSMRARLRRLWHAPKREPAAATPRRCCAEFHFCLVTDVVLLGGSCCLAIKITKLDVDSFLVDLKNTNLQGRITSGPPKCAPHNCSEWDVFRITVSLAWTILPLNADFAKGATCDLYTSTPSVFFNWFTLIQCYRTV